MRKLPYKQYIKNGRQDSDFTLLLKTFMTEINEFSKLSTNSASLDKGHVCN